jgi:hypothetical protein
MPDADRLDRLLIEAGERWRASQLPVPPLERVWKPRSARSGTRPWTLLLAAGLVTVLAAAVVGGGGRPLPTASNAAVGPSTAPSVPSSCFVTLDPDPAPLATQTAGLTLPGFLVPYGAPKLWALIPRSGSLASSTSTTGGRFVRTFWYSTAWSIADEPTPSISVSAGRLGGGDSVTGSAAVSARSRELGTSMIVSLDLPSGGCWQITGTYRDQSLSYVVWVERDSSTVIVSDSTTLPGDVDGVPVTPIADAAAALASTQPGQSILVGGWLTPDVVMSCPMMQTFPDLWNVCFAIRLSPGPWGGEFQAVYRGSSDATLPTISRGQVEPVVLRVHSRDPGCPSTYDCASLPALDAVVWLGRVGPVTSPASTPPPDGISKADAERIAVAEALGSPQRAPGGVVVVSARSGHYAEIGPAGSADVAGDRWVWAVVVSGHFTAPHCQPPTACLSSVEDSLVVLDYVTGTVLLQETPAAPSASDAADARTVLAKYLDAIRGRYLDLAWGFLSAYSRQRFGSEQVFIDAVTGGGRSSGSVQISDPVALQSSDLVDSGYFEPGLLTDVEATAIASRTFFISTLDPSVDGASAGSRTYVVAALDDTEWLIWLAH